MRVITISAWILRVGVLLAVILGILLWTGNFDAIRPIHMLVGIIVVLSLWVIGLAQGFQKGGSFGLAAATFVVGLALVIVGLYQDQWVLGSFHWIIQVIHLLLGLSTVGLGETISGRTRRRARETSAA
jgi:hypothetical protein